MSIISTRPRIQYVDPALLERVRPLLGGIALPTGSTEALPVGTAQWPENLPHLQLAVAVAAQTASVQAGFPQVETAVLSGGALRLEASDGFGHGLLTEVHLDPAGGVNLVTEVAGISDGSCQKVMDAFDKALEAQGVHSQPPRRKPTGGIAELPATRRFLFEKLRRPTTARAASTPIAKPRTSQPDEETRRARRLNATQSLSQKGRR